MQPFLQTILFLLRHVTMRIKQAYVWLKRRATHLDSPSIPSVDILGGLVNESMMKGAAEASVGMEL